MIAFFRRPSITHYVSPEISIGFCQYGPTLTLSGILSTAKHVALVQSIGVSVKVPFHSLKKEFEWFAIQDMPSSSEEPAAQSMRPPSKFVISPGHPYTYNALFTDNWRFSEMKAAFLHISSAWTEELQATQGQELEQAFRTFKDQSFASKMTRMLEDLCYWKTGDYAVSIAVAAKQHVFITEKNFRLEENQAEILRNNSSRILASVCSQPSPLFKTINIPLK